MPDRASLAWIAVLAASVGAVLTALVHQYVFDMLPCAWCVLQRLIFLAIAVVSGLAILLTRAWIRAALAAAVILLAGSGVASAVYQHIVAADTTSCRLSLAERIVGNALHLDTLLPSVFAVRIGCSAGATTLLGIPYEFWSATAFAMLAVAAFATRRRRMPNLP